MERAPHEIASWRTVLARNLGLLVLLLFLAPGASAQVWYQPGAESAIPPKDTTLTIRVHPLAKGVFAAKINYVWTGWVELPDGIMVIDAGMADSAAAALADTIRARSPNLPFRYLVLTHAHEDHILGARRFLDAGATLIAHASTIAQIDSTLGIAPNPAKEIRITKRKRFGSGARLVDVIWFGKPAVSKADLVVYLPKQLVLFTGDLASYKAVPWLLDKDFSSAGWQAALDSLQLSKRYEATVAVPGHGILGTPNEALQFTRNYLRDARDKAAQHAGWNVSLAEVKRWAYLGAYEGLEFYDEVHFMNMRRLYNDAKGIKTPGRGKVRVIRK